MVIRRLYGHLLLTTRLLQQSKQMRQVSNDIQTLQLRLECSSMRLKTQALYSEFHNVIENCQG